MKSLKPFSFILSGILLNLLFPQFSVGWLAWIAFIPFFFGLRSAKSRVKAFLGGLITGLIFYGYSLIWLIHVAWFGWIFVACLEALFFALFALIAFEGFKIKNWFCRIFWISGAWMICEVLRSELPIFGFPWNLLAYSQSDYPPIRLSANAIGAYGLGFVILWINLSLDQFGRDLRMLYRINFWHFFSIGRMSFYELRQPVLNLMQLSAVVIMLLAHGFYYQTDERAMTGSLRVTVVQGNIPQDIKWDVAAREKILEIYMKLSELSVPDQPHLIVWPEAAFPGYFNRDFRAERILEMIRELKIPFLIGSPHSETSDVAFNSAYLVNEHGNISQRYDKQYLVPFGEYVPMPFIFGWLRPLAYALGVSDFFPGRERTVFDLKKTGSLFSSLICFEDIFPSLARAFVAKGARFLVVVTNDAWFMRSAAPYQHLQASVFRAVENGVPVVRSSNTGISAFIDKKGTVVSRVTDAEGKDIFVTGAKTESVPLDENVTFYHSLGYILPWVILAGLGFLVIKWKNLTFAMDFPEAAGDAEN